MGEPIDAQTVRDFGERFSNRDRWGEDDERGTLNFITPERVLAACALPRRGRVISCALPRDERGPRHGTRWDTLREEGEAPRSDARESALERVADGVVGRGVLLDLPRWLRRPWLEGGTRILPQDLDACAEAFGVTVESGDILLVRTGALRRCLAQGTWESSRGGPAPGLSLHCARWLYEREVAAVATDTWEVEVIPNETPDCSQPLHRIARRHMDLLLGESFQLDDLAAACAEDGDYAFLFCAPLLPGPGSPGAPVHPLAIK